MQTKGGNIWESVNHFKGFQDMKDPNLKGRMFRGSPGGGPKAKEIQGVH